tara:strand:+ start:3532 stop:4005 length:474 start_codon:yes stop_codon:yes gene_type:complete
MSDSDEEDKFYTMCSLIARSAFRNGRKNPTDTAGMEERFEDWYLSQDGDADDLILQLYRQLKAQKKKGSKKKKRTKKRTKKKKPIKKAGTGVPLNKTIKKDSWPSSQGRRPKKPHYFPWEKTGKQAATPENISKAIEKSMKKKPKQYRRTVHGMSEI